MCVHAEECTRNLVVIQVMSFLNFALLNCIDVFSFCAPEQLQCFLILTLALVFFALRSLNFIYVVPFQNNVW